MTTRLQRVHRVRPGSEPPIPGDSKGAAHVGDFPLDLPLDGPVFSHPEEIYVEIVDFNDDREHPEYVNVEGPTKMTSRVVPDEG